jgi:hypothetical protein
MQTEVVSNMTGLAALPLEGNFRDSSREGGSGQEQGGTWPKGTAPKDRNLQALEVSTEINELYSTAR